MGKDNLHQSTQKNFSCQNTKLHLVWVFSGSLEHVLDSATWLETTRELLSFGWSVSLITFGSYGTHQIQGVEVFCLPTINLYFLRHFIYNLLINIFLVINWSSIDFILFHQASAPWVLPLKVLRRFNDGDRPLFIMDTRTVLMEDLNKGNWRDRFRGWFYKLTSYISNNWADGQTANTLRMAECIGVPQDRLWGIWPAGANIELFKPAQTIRCWPSDNDAIRLIYIGVINFERNLLSLCQAIEMANQGGMQFTLSIIGDGTEREELEEYAAKTNGRIIVNTPVPHDKIPDYLAKAHIGVIPFPNEEKFRVGSPIKLFEYMAAGLPILATRIVCHTDVIGDESYVFWAEEGSVVGLLAALRLIWIKKKELLEMGKQAAFAAKDHTWHASAERLSIALKSHIRTKR